MPAYVIVDIDVHDAVRYEKYKDMATPTVSAFGGRYAVRGGKVSVLEGTWPTNRFVVLEFPTAEQAKAWWDSEQYRPAKALRHQTATTKMILVEGA
jgi:uncharacterized protein (DUF1330 family)